MEVSHKKESLLMTTALFALLFALLFFLTYNSSALISQLEGGGGGGEIAVNFGNSDVGSGDNFESMELAQAAPKAKAIEKTQPDELVTNASDDDVPAVNSTKTIKKEETKKEIVKPVEEPQKRPSKSATDALSSLLGGSSSKGGDGTDGVSGNKGKMYGDPKATGYNGGGGSGTGSGGGNGSGQGLGTGSGYGNGYGGGSGNGNGNWKLAGRKLASSSKQVQKCNESGTVVVQVTVNRNGNVIDTKYTKGTTNTSQCLLDPAYATARSYRWQPNPDAPETQVGTITINFKLGE